MRFFFALTIYRLILPLLFITAFPSWVVKMLRRGGFGTHLGERAAFYRSPIEEEPCGCVHFHAVSVGESMLALKLIREWMQREPERRFALATGTATGHAIGTGANLPGLRVTYAPLDFRWMVRRYLKRFEPSQIVLVEGEVWPNLLLECKKRAVPVRLVNARMSPRSARRFVKFSAWLRPIYGLLDAVAIQEPADAAIWQNLGISSQKIHRTGSLKFDPGSGNHPAKRPEFQSLLDAFGRNRPVVLAASTHLGEEVYLATAVREAAPEALIVIVPRHAERRAEVKNALIKEGFEPILRSSFMQPRTLDACLVVDSTGELRDWTAHADAVMIGKSFLSIGGQNPTEAILAQKPVIHGPHMENFQPLVSRLLETSGSLLARDRMELRAAIITALMTQEATKLTQAASACLTHHRGATARILDLLK